MDLLDMRMVIFKYQVFLAYYPETLHFLKAVPSSQLGID